MRPQARTLRTLPGLSGVEEAHQGELTALRQHPELARAIIAGDPNRAADLAARHFSLTEDLLRELHARIRVRSGKETDAGSQGQ